MTSKFAGQDVASWVGIGAPAGKAPTGQAHAVRPSGGAAAPSAGKTEGKEAQDVIRTMQDLMSDLGTQLQSDQVAKTIAGKYSISADTVKSQALHFGRTAASAPRAAPKDGVWGSNTKAALVAIKNFVASLKITGVVITEGEGNEPFHTMKEQDLTTQARNNINNLFRLFSELGIQSRVVGAPGAEGMEILDSVEPNLPDASIEEPFKHWGNLPVTKGDIASFYSFFKFMQRLTPPWDCTPVGGKPVDRKKASVEMLAKEILENTIVRIGQRPSASVPIPSAEPEPAERPKHGVLCVSVIDKIIDWFFQRAKVMYIELHDALVESRPSPRPDRRQDRADRRQDRVIAQSDVTLGQYYVDKMGDILAAWDANRDAIIDALKSEGKSDTDPVTLKTLRDAEAGGHTTGQAHRQRGEGEETGYTIHQNTLRPPLGNFIDLSEFEKTRGSNDLINLSRSGRLQELNIEDWRHDPWTSIAEANVAGRDDSEKYANFGKWAVSVRSILENIYDDFKSDMFRRFDEWRRGNHNEQLLENKRNEFNETLRSQKSFLSSWINRINSVIGTWNTEYAQPMARARQGR